MQFVANGPDIPEALLQAHEEGRVVFFCGAGISYPAALPLFKGLVRDIYDRLGLTMNPLEQSAFKKDQYDLTLDLLEHRHRGGRLAVRRELANALRPNLRRAGATTTHESLLHLARDRDGALRLLTTNFDRIFELVAKRLRLPHQVFSAPMLPIPKSSRWDGLVYLHGLQPSKTDDAALHRLVVTSGDFGLAYLTERWAARFVTDLFRNYVVCFVGYSINDPVLRYMMDALAADRMLGEQSPQAYAFGACQPGAEATSADDWRAKGVEPILYSTPVNAKGHEDHSALPKTLQAWARTYRAGALGKESIVTAYALTNPSENTQQDDFVGRMLWALSDPRGLAAKCFAEMQPAPPITWLEAFSDKRFRHGDLARFGVPAHATEDEQLRFSLISRPAAYQYAPWMALGGYPRPQSTFDPIMGHLANWITRHLNDPHCLLWLLEQGPTPHPTLAWTISQKLNEHAKLRSDGKDAELESVLAHSPNAIANPVMRTLWEIYLSGRIKHRSSNVDMYDWAERFKREGITAMLRSQLRELLSPRVEVRKSWRGIAMEEHLGDRGRIKQSIDWELTLVADQVHHQVRELHELRILAPVLPELLADLQQLLSEALHLMVELGDANTYSDRSYWDLPSVSAHDQNSDFRTWVVLIELLRDAWIEINKGDVTRATGIAQEWFRQPFACFKRLALFAASHDHVVAPSEWVYWLLSDDRRWLWVAETMRECMRLLVLQGAQLRPKDQSVLEAAILQGPPRHLFRDDTSADTWTALVAHSTWLHLAKLESSGLTLGTNAKQRLNQLSTENPHFRLAPDQSDEFSHWSGSTWDGIDMRYREPNPAPATRKRLIDWLRRQLDTDSTSYETSWPERCRTRLYRSASALKLLAEENVWPAMHWREALLAWSDDTLAFRSWNYLSTIVLRMPDATFALIARAAARWLRGAAASLAPGNATLLTLCARVLAVAHENTFDQDEPLNQAINHPVGQVTEALITYWFKHDPQDHTGLPLDIEPLFSQLAAPSFGQFRHGRVILASRLIALFRVDQAWTIRHLLPNFDWGLDKEEARAAWSGFMWSARLYAPLLTAFKKPLLATTQHFAELGEHRRRFAAYLTYAALDPIETYSAQEFQAALCHLPKEGLHQVAQTLAQAQEAAGERREEFWQSRLRPFWQRIWPKDRHFASSEISCTLANICVAAGDEFPNAVQTMSDWFMETEGWSSVVRKLHKSGLDTRFPVESLAMLSAIISEKGWPPPELRETLHAILSVAPSLEKDPRFVRLNEYLRSRGT